MRENAKFLYPMKTKPFECDCIMLQRLDFALTGEQYRPVHSPMSDNPGSSNGNDETMFNHRQSGHHVAMASQLLVYQFQIPALAAARISNRIRSKHLREHYANVPTMTGRISAVRSQGRSKSAVLLLSSVRERSALITKIRHLLRSFPTASL